MKKYRVYGLYRASKFLGEFEGNTEVEAIEAAENSADVFPNICHQCAREIEIGDLSDMQAEEIEAAS